MKAIIYLNQNSINEFDNLEDAYSFTLYNECDEVKVINEGKYTVEQFQLAFSNDEF